jgi:chromosomal replication initiation ATPase DnaA
MADLSKVEIIVTLVAEKENVIDHLIMSDRRNASIVHARNVVIYLVYTLTNYSMPAIGRIFNRDHTTVLHSIRKIEAERKASPMFDSTIRQYHSILGHHHHLRDPDVVVKLPRKKISKIPIAPLESTN